MGRPTTKADLIEAAKTQYDKLWNLIDAMPEDKQAAAFNFGDFQGKEAHWARDKNLRDVLVHLYEWHQLLLNWVDINQKGQEKPFLPAPYNWKTYGEMNVAFWQKHQGTSLEAAKAMLKTSHAAVMTLIDGFSSDTLFQKGAFEWTGGSTLGSYCVSATSSHYGWAIKKLKKFR